MRGGKKKRTIVHPKKVTLNELNLLLPTFI